MSVYRRVITVFKSTVCGVYCFRLFVPTPLGWSVLTCYILIRNQRESEGYILMNKLSVICRICILLWQRVVGGIYEGSVKRWGGVRLHGSYSCIFQKKRYLSCSFLAWYILSTKYVSLLCVWSISHVPSFVKRRERYL